MKISYRIDVITYDERNNRYSYKFQDRYDTYFKSFHHSLTHEQCIAEIEKQVIAKANKKKAEELRDRSKHAGKLYTIEVGK